MDEYFRRAVDQTPRAWAAAPVPRRAALSGFAGATVLAGLFSCGRQDAAPVPPAPKPKAKLVFEPGDGAKDVNPVTVAKVTATSGTIIAARLISDKGRIVAGTLAQDGSNFATTAPLDFGARYVFTGEARNADGVALPFLSGFATLDPATVAEVNVNIGDGQSVGVAAPVILRFSAPVKDKAAVERKLKVTCEPQTEGSWAWLPDAVGEQAHWRPRQYFAPGTAVHVEAPLLGADFGDGVYCGTTLSSDFTIARHQLVKCFVPSHRIQVLRGDAVIMDFPCSYGEGDQYRNVTRTGVHVVTEKFVNITMSNPPFYTNARERWAVRISNNGEFIHANPNTVGDQGVTNVSNGCVNLSEENAQQYFNSALYGDPVEVTGTSVNLSEADGEIYDWTYSWDKWTSLSALK